MGAVVMDELQEAVTQMRADYKANPVEPDVWNVLRALNDRHDCSRCGRCCTDQTIGMTGPEIVIAARYLNVPCSGFKKMFIERQVQRWHILKKLDGACPFLYGDDGKTECLIYAVRPEVCRRFPWLSPDIVLRTKLPNVACNDGICPNMSKTFAKAKGAK